MVITDINQLDVNGTYTYADYLLWRFKEQVELLRGKLFKMSPAPREIHQRVLNEINFELMSFFRNKTCRVYPAPFDVRIPAKGAKGTTDNQIYTIVQPDLCVVCDLEKIDGRGCVGVPDLVVEILSPSNSRKDLKDKYEIYQEAGVPEYWIVDADDKAIYRYVLEGDTYIGLPPVSEGDVFSSRKFPEMKIDTKLIFK
ncbi:Uma2 family endonuclease [Capnocytophaga granulosa]